MPFTPFESTTSRRRLALDLSADDARKIERGHWGPVKVTDIRSGTVVEVQGADCGADCFCAAEVVRVVSFGENAMCFFDEDDDPYVSGDDVDLPPDVAAQMRDDRERDDLAVRDNDKIPFDDGENF